MTVITRSALRGGVAVLTLCAAHLLVMPTTARAGATQELDCTDPAQRVFKECTGAPVASLEPAQPASIAEAPIVGLPPVADFGPSYENSCRAVLFGVAFCEAPTITFDVAAAAQPRGDGGDTGGGDTDGGDTGGGDTGGGDTGGGDTGGGDTGGGDTGGGDTGGGDTGGGDTGDGGGTGGDGPGGQGGAGGKGGSGGNGCACG